MIKNQGGIVRQVIILYCNYIICLNTLLIILFKKRKQLDITNQKLQLGQYCTVHINNKQNKIIGINKSRINAQK